MAFYQNALLRLCRLMCGNALRFRQSLIRFRGLAPKLGIARNSFWGSTGRPKAFRTSDGIAACPGIWVNRRNEQQLDRTNERGRLFELEDTGETLRIKAPFPTK